MNDSDRPIVLYSSDSTTLHGSDCDCACPVFIPTHSSLEASSGALLQRHPDQQQIPLAPGYNVVFVPSLSHIAVLNDAALDVLRRFSTPRPLPDASCDERATILSLCELGLIQEYGTHQPPPSAANELIAWLHVTNACNLRCTYCYIDKSDEAMSAETAFAAIDAVLRSAQQNGYSNVLLKYAGGEASLNMPLVEEMHRYALARAASVLTLRGVVLSNGVGLTRHKLQRLRDLGLRLMISLDGLQEFHDAQRPRLGGQGSFASVVAGIARARELGIDLTISVTVTSASVSGLPALLIWLLEHQIHFTLNFYRECDASANIAALKLDQQRLIAGMRAAYNVIEQNLPDYSLLGCLLDRANLGVAHQRTCGVGESYMVIDQRGNIAKCQMEIKRPVTTIWETDPLGVIRLEPAGVQNLPVAEKQGCRDCQWRYWCAGGCAVATFRATGRYDIRSPNCEIYKALYPDVIRLEGLRLLRAAQIDRSMTV